MKNKLNKSKILSSLCWKLMERGGTQGIQFIIQILLARLLLPEDYGNIALVVIFTTIAGVFVQSGLNTALIQKKDADETDISSVFYLSLFIAFLIYIILFFVAPFIATFFEEHQITSVFRVLSITLFFGAFNSIQNAVVARNLQFKKLFFSSTGAILISGIVGIYMAYTGFEVWALVGQQISNQLFMTMILWYTVRWRPKLLFSLSRVKRLFSFGWKLLVAALLDTVYRDIRSLIIGKMYNPVMLGFYNRGQQFPSIIVSNINGSIQSVMLPVLSSQQDNRPRVKNMMRRAIVTSSFIIFPMMVGLAVIAEPLVKILLTDKWLPCVPFMQFFCAIYALWPIHTANLQALNALGRSDIFLKLEIIKKTMGLSILAITVFYGIYAIAFGQVVGGIISTFINAYPNKHLLGYSYKEQWNDIMPSLLLSLMMGGVVYSFKWFGLSVLTTLIVQVCIGAILYIGLAWMLKIECFYYLLSSAKEIFVRKKGKTI
jgi:teichuronic acid exporter